LEAGASCDEDYG
jgi:hypothetical protein